MSGNVKLPRSSSKGGEGRSIEVYKVLLAVMILLVSVIYAWLSNNMVLHTSIARIWTAVVLPVQLVASSPAHWGSLKGPWQHKAADLLVSTSSGNRKLLQLSYWQQWINLTLPSSRIHQ
jgi:hypothetical protein